ncbi:helix-turn-helix transcriptional regulator [Lactiplantibacillus fabifermentans]|uniref:HTH cro/C1-type domain-containing protein n=2 Tax=Lactiplantibacillus fabifermentans TaxID=483011 RepID=A0A0R2NR76_9LACO|nr:helix-turn-helix domain-containing protein [Lactiplantibacillus fabifermentans]ETY73851.1 XRE family transcriptional regulator [Lactiplantibacillus fabifermentans T30PCM01]KRO28191.1 hypothetical protein DY78_GL002573 [Lactiplantibacillus fabifermentans DSM 21115]
MELGERLKVTRQQHGQTQQAVADQLHVARQTISSWETGHSYPDLETLLQLSDFYDLSLDQLLREDTQAVPKIQRQIVLKQLHGIRRWLVGGNLVVIAVLVAVLFSWPWQLVAPIVIMGLGVCDVVALNRVNRFQAQLAPKSPLLLRERWPWLAAYLWLPAVALMILGGWGTVQNNWAAGALAVGTALGFFWLIMRTQSAVSPFK